MFSRAWSLYFNSKMASYPEYVLVQSGFVLWKYRCIGRKQDEGYFSFDGDDDDDDQKNSYDAAKVDDDGLISYLSASPSLYHEPGNSTTGFSTYSPTTSGHYTTQNRNCEILWRTFEPIANYLRPLLVRGETPWSYFLTFFRILIVLTWLGFLPVLGIAIAHHLMYLDG